MKIYSKENEFNLFDKLDISLTFPVIKIVKFNSFEEPVKGIDIKFNTEFIYRKGEDYWYLGLIFLGFGFTILRQTDF
jgi:hypothetical protein